MSRRSTNSGESCHLIQTEMFEYYGQLELVVKGSKNHLSRELIVNPDRGGGLGIKHNL